MQETTKQTESESGGEVYDRATEGALAAIAIGVGGNDASCRALHDLLRATGRVQDAVICAMSIASVLRRPRARGVLSE